MTSNDEPERLTPEVIYKAIEEIEKGRLERTRDLGHRIATFMEWVPEEMRSEPIVSRMVEAFYAEPIHPKDAERLKAEYEKRYREVMGRDLF